jgi:hypothetical protein
VATRPTFARCIECGRDVHRGPPPQTVLPAGTEPFAASPDCALQRRRHDGGLCYFDAGGLLQAVVAGGECRSLGGDVVFVLEAYEPGGLGSYVVLDDGRPIGTYLVRTRLPQLEVDVRDATSAPVGTLDGATTSFRLRETGGGTVAVAERRRVPLDDEWVDDRWTLDVADEPPTLDRRALVAALLVCHHLVSPAPVDSSER